MNKPPRCSSSSSFFYCFSFKHSSTCFGHQEPIIRSSTSAVAASGLWSELVIAELLVVVGPGRPDHDQQTNNNDQQRPTDQFDSQHFRLLKSMQTNSGCHPTVISIGNQHSFGGVNEPGHGTVCSSQFTAEAKNERTSISSMRPNGQIYF